MKALRVLPGGVALLLAGALYAADSTTACPAIFDNGVTSHGPGADIDFDRDAQLLGVSSSVLNFDKVKLDGKSSALSCDTVDCSAGGGVAATLDPGPFVDSISKENFDAPDDGTMLLVSDYHDVDVKDGATLGVNPAIDEYHLHQVRVDEGATLALRAGDYWIDKLELRDGAALTVVGSGTVRIFTNDLKIGKDVLINSPAPGVAGDPSSLFLWTSDDVKIDKDSTFSGFIYGEKKLELEDGASAFGAVSAGRNVKLKRNSTWTYDAAAIGDTDFGCLCSCVATVVGLDIDHDGYGIHCVDEPVTVTAVTASGAAAAAYAEQISLRTSTGRGGFTLLAGGGVLDDPTPDDGSATYQFASADAGTATFALSYREGPALVDVDAEQTSDPSVRDDDSEGPITFAPSGFTVTGSVLPNPPPSPIVDPIPNQVAGVGFPLHLTAYGVTEDDPVCGVIESYGGPRNLTFDMTYVNPGSGTRTATVDDLPVGSGVPQPVTFTSGQGVVNARYKDAGAIRLTVQDAGSFPNTLLGASNSFVSRPARLVISRIQSAAGVDNPAAASATGAAFVPAGEAFEVDVDALDADDDLTPNYGLEAPGQGLRVTSEVLVVPASGGRNGSIGDVIGGTAFVPAALAGRFTNTQVVFDEVGAIRLRPGVDDGDYLGAGPVPGLLSAPVGRFFPAAFDVLSSTVDAACGAFTYMDHPALSLRYVLQALNTAGAVTENYDTGLLGAAATADPRLTAEAADDGVDRAARLGAPGGAWSAGEVVVDRNDLVFARAAAPDGPFDPLDIGLAVDDPLDGVSLLALDTDAATSGDCVAAGSCSARLLGAATRVVYGRMAVLPAAGPENEVLRIPLVAQVYTGAAFEAHPADSCSTYQAADVSLSGYSGNLQAGETAVVGPAGGATLLSGASDPANPVRLAAPGFGNDGTVRVTVDVAPWLEFDWQGTGLADPAATAAFGRYRGHDRIIFWGEGLRF